MTQIPYFSILRRNTENGFGSQNKLLNKPYKPHVHNEHTAVRNKHKFVGVRLNTFQQEERVIWIRLRKDDHIISPDTLFLAEAFP